MLKVFFDTDNIGIITDMLDAEEHSHYPIQLFLSMDEPLKITIAGKALSEILDYTLEDLRYYVKRFKHLDYTKTENRQALIDTFVNKVFYYGNKSKPPVNWWFAQTLKG